MSDLYKYGVAVHLYKPMIKRALVDFAVGADWTPAAGDVKISKDGGAAANVTNLPSAIAMGNAAMWDFSLTATEMEAAKIRITVSDAATKAVEDTLFEIDTYGNVAAQHEFDLDVPAVGGVAQTGDSFARIGATGGGLTSLASQASVTAVKTKTDLLTFGVPGLLTVDVLRVNGSLMAGDGSILNPWRKA